MRIARAPDESYRLTAAIFGLLGVIVGGVLNAGAALWQERRRERREARPTARLVMTELTEIQAVLIADVHREPEYRMGRVRPPTEWPRGRERLASVVDGETWTALNSAYMMAEYIFVREQVELPMRALYGRAWHPHEISHEIHRAQSRLQRYADLPSSYEPPEPIGPE